MTTRAGSLRGDARSGGSQRSPPSLSAQAPWLPAFRLTCRNKERGVILLACLVTGSQAVTRVIEETPACGRTSRTHTRSQSTHGTGATVHCPPPCRSRLGATSGSTSSPAPVRSAASSAAFRRWSADACRHSCRHHSLHKCASWGSKSTSRATRRSGGCPARRFATLPTRPPALVPKMRRQRRAASCRSFSDATGSALRRLSPRWRCRASGGK